MIREEIKHITANSGASELRKFGRTIGIFLGIVAGVLFYLESGAATVVAGIAVGFLVLGLAVPIVLKPIYIGWMSFAIVMGFFMTKVILTLVFSIALTPGGVIMRLLGKDPMNQKIDKNADSYWIRREAGNFDPTSVEKQY